MKKFIALFVTLVIIALCSANAFAEIDEDLLMIYDDMTPVSVIGTFDFLVPSDMTIICYGDGSGYDNWLDEYGAALYGESADGNTYFMIDCVEFEEFTGNLVKYSEEQLSEFLSIFTFTDNGVAYKINNSILYDAVYISTDFFLLDKETGTYEKLLITLIDDTVWILDYYRIETGSFGPFVGFNEANHINGMMESVISNFAGE